VTEHVDVRCPANLRRLFMKLQLAGARPVYTEGNLLEIACADCRRELRRHGVEVAQVLHYYNFLGELITTEQVPLRPEDGP
jgi:hypothetical protein